MEPRVTQCRHERQGWVLCVRRWHNPHGAGSLIALHGAGVAGELTFAPMLPQLQGYRDVWVPDLYGAGDSVHEQGEMPFEITDLVEHLLEFTSDNNIQDYDLIGYSFGGLVAMMVAQHPQVRRLVLVEPALMESLSWADTMARRARYVDATAPLLAGLDPVQAVSAFLDIVSPMRSRHPRVESRVVARLAHRPLGLAYALDAVGRHAQRFDREAVVAALPPTLSLVGSRTPDVAHGLHQALASRRDDWRYLSVAGVDHALPYQKPAVVAEASVKWFKRGGV